MAIFRCNKCGYLREVPDQHIGKKVACPVCKQMIPIYDTVFFVKNMLKQYFNVKKELANLQPPTPSNATNNPELDIFNTTAMTEKQQYQPILNWFEKKNIQLSINKKALDTTGFFDEVAVKLGENYGTLRIVTDKIKRTQKKGYTHLTLNLSNYGKEANLIEEFCKELYEYAFVARYFFNKKKNFIHLDLQTATPIVNFFNGEWLEWFAFMEILALCHKYKFNFAGLRSFKIHFPNKDSNELDIFFLINETPIFIECKSGEFRSFIDKYAKMRKRLNMDTEKFFMLVVDLTDEQMQSLTHMFDITFVNEKTFVKQITTLLVNKA
ncbi:hypothetical protein QUF74_17315 [Candidatus Halobeggiatoa sp. HSG11]|nr:hypothetical protein [Candidatus Halobeggiatoa sp. HSG11]